MEENRIVTRDYKTFYFEFDWPKDVDGSLKHKIEFIIKSNESLAENKIRIAKLSNYCPSISMETIFMSMNNGKTNEPHKIFLNLSQRLDLTSPNKHAAL